ncbi:hypothetical protein LIER_31494 [Lithospermum erythrorhizon]|uniref:Uncharacterized protein n=1 Tax=Lithospermum erythrorhizon TaxID=34254 RepID=A0AAV3RR50_LITER
MEGMDIDIPSATDTANMIVEPADEGVIPSVVDTRAETAEGVERTTVGQGVNDTLDADIEDVVPEEAVDHVPEEEVPPVMQPTVSAKWLPKHEQGGNAKEEDHESDEEDVAAVIIRRWKATGKLKLNEN